MLSTVILALDGPDSERAVPLARELAARFDAEVVLVHVCEQVLAGRRGWISAHVEEAALRERLEREAHRMRMAGVEARLDVRTARLGFAADAIAEAAREHRAGAIVVATKGASPVLGVLSGSVTQSLLHKAPCPVIAVPPERARVRTAA